MHSQPIDPVFESHIFTAQISRHTYQIRPQ